MEETTAAPWFLRCPDLASERLGGRVLAASDEFFAPKENLLWAEPAAYSPDRYTERGKWMDGWETRRRRGPGHDWAIIRLGAPGVIHGVNMDTRHFRGNHPERASIEACAVEEEVEDEQSGGWQDWSWTTLVPASPLAPDADNLFAVGDRRRWTHVRLAIFPDGGVARLRIHGIGAAGVLPRRDEVDLVALRNGGVVLAWSDARFGPPHSLLLPDRPLHMGDGWETRRRRGPGHDWVVIRVGVRGVPHRVEVDTTHFKGNFPESFALDTLDDGGEYGDPQAGLGIPPDDHPGWREVVPRTPLGPDATHSVEIQEASAVTHIRLNIHPDGGVARLRLYGEPVEERRDR